MSLSEKENILKSVIDEVELKLYQKYPQLLQDKKDLLSDFQNGNNIDDKFYQRMADDEIAKRLLEFIKEDPTMIEIIIESDLISLNDLKYDNYLVLKEAILSDYIDNPFEKILKKTYFDEFPKSFLTLAMEIVNDAFIIFMENIYSFNNNNKIISFVLIHVNDSEENLLYFLHNRSKFQFLNIDYQYVLREGSKLYPNIYSLL